MITLTPEQHARWVAAVAEWPTCELCQGLGTVPGYPHHADNRKPCPACVAGRVPPPHLLELRELDPGIATSIKIQDGCWLWVGAIRPDGYGTVTRRKMGGRWAVHRLVYELLIGQIPEGMTLGQSCDHRHCINPLHQEPRQRSTGRFHVVQRVSLPGTPQATPCRVWQGRVTQDGYPAYGDHLLHRWVMEKAIGRPLRQDEYVLHHCDNPPCFRFDHLFIGTPTDNTADMMAKGRAGWQKATT